LAKVKKLWEEYRERTPITCPLPSGKNEVQQQPETKELDDFDEIAEKLAKYARPASQDEYEDYCQGETCDIGELSALQWWRQDSQKKRWPRLSLMAIDILSIPAMSAEPERVFSGGRRTVSWDRTQMTAETLEMVECLKHWKRSGILKQFIESS
jgi:hypothetical protein